jgi:anti-anti-sigma regulatory factor
MMGVIVERRDEGNVVRLEGTVDISSAVELKGHLLETLKSGQDLRLDLSAATYLDVTAIQLLWAAQREAGVRGARCFCEGQVPEAVRSSLRDGGFEKLLFFAGADAGNGELE